MVARMVMKEAYEKVTAIEALEAKNADFALEIKHLITDYNALAENYSAVLRNLTKCTEEVDLLEWYIGSLPGHGEIDYDAIREAMAADSSVGELAKAKAKKAKK